MWGTLASRYLLRKKLGSLFGSPWFFNSITASERYASADLDLAHDGVGREACDLAIARAAVNAVRRLAQVDMVEHVEEFSSQLRVHPFCDAEVLKYGEIRIEEVRSGQLISAGAKLADLRPQIRSASAAVVESA